MESWTTAETERTADAELLIEHRGGKKWQRANEPVSGEDLLTHTAETCPDRRHGRASNLSPPSG